jgi:hypothetical protein
MKNWVNKIINRIKQWRLVGYIILAKPLIDIHGMEQGIIEIFLLVVLGEISARTKTRQITNKEYKESIQKKEE